MEKLTLTEEQIVVNHTPRGNAGSPDSQKLTPRYTVANDDTDGTDGDVVGDGSGDGDGA